MNLETFLATIPVSEWETKLTIVLDWFDGPREGICSLSNPVAEFYFELLDERPTADDLDDRLFRLREIPPGSVNEVLFLIRDLGSPTNTIWVPVWKFSDEKAKQKAESYLENLRTNARPISIIISTPDFIHFRGCWDVGLKEGNGANWFSKLKIPTGN